MKMYHLVVVQFTHTRINITYMRHTINGYTPVYTIYIKSIKRNINTVTYQRHYAFITNKFSLSSQMNNTMFFKNISPKHFPRMSSENLRNSRWRIPIIGRRFDSRYACAPPNSVGFKINKRFQSAILSLRVWILNVRGKMKTIVKRYFVWRLIIFFNRKIYTYDQHAVQNSVFRKHGLVVFTHYVRIILSMTRLYIRHYFYIINNWANSIAKQKCSLYFLSEIQEKTCVIKHTRRIHKIQLFFFFLDLI